VSVCFRYALSRARAEEKEEERFFCFSRDFIFRRFFFFVRFGFVCCGIVRDSGSREGGAGTGEGRFSVFFGQLLHTKVLPPFRVYWGEIFEKKKHQP